MRMLLTPCTRTFAVWSSQIASLSKEVKQRGPAISELAAAIQGRQEKMAGMERQINNVKDSMFASFSKQVSLSWGPVHSAPLASAHSTVCPICAVKLSWYACISKQLTASATPSCLTTQHPVCPHVCI